MAGSGTVVVGVDGTRAALNAVRWAVGRAERCGVGVHLVHGVEPPCRDDARRAQASHWLTEARDVAETTATGVPVTVATGDLLAGAMLVRESVGASLVVLGARGHGGYSGRLIGATAPVVAAGGSCPMVVMGEVGEVGAGPVVVGVDGTWTSDAAVDFAFREAALHRCGLVAVHSLPGPLVRGATALGHDQADDVAAAIAERLVAWQRRYPEVHVSQRLVQDLPGKALLAHATDSRLIVVGNRGRSGLRGIAIHSTGQHLLHHATCPVAVVRRDQV